MKPLGFAIRPPHGCYAVVLLHVFVWRSFGSCNDGAAEVADDSCFECVCVCNLGVVEVALERWMSDIVA